MGFGKRKAEASERGRCVKQEFHPGVHSEDRREDEMGNGVVRVPSYICCLAWEAGRSTGHRTCCTAVRMSPGHGLKDRNSSSDKLQTWVGFVHTVMVQR